ncbi:D-ribose pyranase [Saccharococcus caldoxylosilyticus]|uniref:D-ribose pyranase n=1 Tax=Saccharococcus caldoxylosilyticus TaxID=81408 RepID=UPI001FCAE183|nr:D-ribose pyranase [Parageobacillus caldoxylosilyticus]BDG36362.1 D-ribose pyranase [Parageobacillus caldoxylosilyticus]BDG40149.1 D-ribose pyranase [Parageobacillus caldoxylosilyticus]BDG43875.1 D-ribose pyranase [Parageobacillus caldoxylosilyticus]
MKKGGILNPKVNQLISETGHTDMIVITDAGLPIPGNVAHRIDLALKEGVPRFLETLDTVLTELQVEKVILSEEIKTTSPEMNKEILKRFPNIPVEYVPHDEFKQKTKSARGCIRSGEFTPYANVILVAGVVY